MTARDKLMEWAADRKDFWEIVKMVDDLTQELEQQAAPKLREKLVKQQEHHQRHISELNAEAERVFETTCKEYEQEIKQLAQLTAQIMRGCHCDYDYRCSNCDRLLKAQSHARSVLEKYE